MPQKTRNQNNGDFKWKIRLKPPFSIEQEEKINKMRTYALKWRNHEIETKKKLKLVISHLISWLEVIIISKLLHYFKLLILSF